MSINSYDRESVEYQPVVVTRDGVAVTASVEFAVVAHGDRPVLANWAAPTLLGGKIGVLVTGYLPGTYDVWAKITDSPETPIIECGYFQVT